MRGGEGGADIAEEQRIGRPRHPGIGAGQAKGQQAIAEGVVAEHPRPLRILAYRDQHPADGSAQEEELPDQRQREEAEGHGIARAVGGHVEGEDGAGGAVDDEPLVPSGPLAEIEHGEIAGLREHQGDDHEGGAGGAQGQQPDRQRQPAPRGEARQQGAAASLARDEAGGIEAGAEEHRMAEAEQPGIAEGDVVAGGVDGQHQDAREVGDVVGRQQQRHQRQHRQQAEMQGPDPATAHRAARP